MAAIVCSSALLGLNVTATYALLAAGRVRAVMYASLIAGIVMLLMMIYLAPRLGIKGVAFARLGYATIPLFLYLPLLRILFQKQFTSTKIAALQPAGGEQ
jgi:O-antigen/teichoic acid export membrane protein